MTDFKLTSNYTPSGDQPKAIDSIVFNLEKNVKNQVLLGVTGSGKTFTIANVIQEYQKPTIILSHNKTLAAQLYGEFKSLFPKNSVEFFISYYDYYQPEAYLPVTDTFIEKADSNSTIEPLNGRIIKAKLDKIGTYINSMNFEIRELYAVPFDSLSFSIPEEYEQIKND